MKRPLPAFSMLLGLIVSCGSADSVVVDVTPQSAVSAGMAALAGAVNAGNANPSAISRAVTSCGAPAASDTDCVSSQKRATYSNCTITTSKHRYSGSVILTYSNPSCDLSAQESSFTRTVDITRLMNYANDENPISSVKTSVESKQDFRTLTMGGGTKLTRAAPDLFYLEILGVHKIRYVDDVERPIYDVSIRTISPLEVTAAGGNLSGSRTVTNGKIEFIHNRGKFVAEGVPLNLTYDSDKCCHPTGGQLSITFTDSSKVTGTATVTFSSACGTASFTRDGSTSTINLNGCE